MTWQTLILVLLDFFGPLLRAILGDLFAGARNRLAATAMPTVTAVALRELFRQARAETWLWQLGRRRLLAACERIALTRSLEIERACAGTGPTPALSTAEVVELAELT